MNANFLHSKNFKARLLTGILLAIVVILSLVTPDSNLFRAFYTAGGIMACIEIHLSQCIQDSRGVFTRNNQAIVLEYVILLVSVYAISFYLSTPEIILTLLGAISADIFAYFTGSALHGKFFKTQPFPKTSPKKSWEGIIGGYIGCILTLLVATKVLSLELRLPIIVFMTTCPIISIFGDWLASFCKRFLDIKDSSDGIEKSRFSSLKLLEKFMSGHGGYLDRIDSISMVACLMFWLKLTTNPQ